MWTVGIQESTQFRLLAFLQKWWVQTLALTFRLALDTILQLSHTP